MAYRGGSNKNAWALFLLILAGIVVFGFLGSFADEVPFLGWLNYGLEFGIGKPYPISVDLQVIVLELKLIFNITIASVLGTALGVLIYRQI